MRHFAACLHVKRPSEPVREERLGVVGEAEVDVEVEDEADGCC
jgi:hypothetical protein